MTIQSVLVFSPEAWHQVYKTFWIKKSMLFFCEQHKFIQFKLWKLQFWPLNDQIAVSFVRAAGVLAKGHMFDMPDLVDLTLAAHNKCTQNFGQKNKGTGKSDMQYWDCLPHNWDELPYSLQTKHQTNTT